MDNIVINKTDLEFAQMLCSVISDTDSRNRAVANVIGARIASRYFNPDTYSVDADTALHNIAIVNETYDISDIYVNNAYIDVRVYFSEDELCVPKSHFETGILPVAYMFIKLSQDLSDGTVTGFILPDNITKNNENSGCYYIKEESLVPLSEIEPQISNITDSGVIIPGEQIYKFTEGSLDETAKMSLLKNLISDRTSRAVFTRIIKAQSILNMVSSVEFPAAEVQVENPENNLDELFNNTEQAESKDEADSILEELEYSTEVTPSGAEVIESLDNKQNAEQIDSLFTGEQNGVPVPSKKSSGGFFGVLILLIILCGGGYWWYTNYYTQNNNDFADLQEPLSAQTDEIPEPTPDEPVSAMPNETVNNTPDINAENKETGNSVEIPAIEQNLDASVLVSNLKVDWEVPAGYVSNTAARRYLMKLGKIIQLNLKSELLLLTKPPIANKITVELTFDRNANRFDVVGFQNSSGEKTVDATILETIKSALKMNISSNFESFGKLQGNPVLIIHL